MNWWIGGFVFWCHEQVKDQISKGEICRPFYRHDLIWGILPILLHILPIQHLKTILLPNIKYSSDHFQWSVFNFKIFNIRNLYPPKKWENMNSIWRFLWKIVSSSVLISHPPPIGDHVIYEWYLCKVANLVLSPSTSKPPVSEDLGLFWLFEWVRFWFWFWFWFLVELHDGTISGSCWCNSWFALESLICKELIKMNNHL